ncbi:Uncharacterized protein TPAR_06283 [Tolypocladium paradoxum]|uniref:MARVEL domain-containing protein n=1 Tax=Tolypocladium paradoxum TaxID=94208 RepID=A0A2S4KTI7_9HYPO|nr:Uncharacterized protein TPAR_06283 [Tolypocladium paradoxum]
MAPETSTQAESRTEPQTTTTMQPQDNSLPTPPPGAWQTQRDSSSPLQPAQPYMLYPASYGAPFIPYSENREQRAFQQHQLNPHQFATLQRPVVPERKAWRITKDVLHVLSVVLSIVGLGFGFSLLSYGPRFDGAVGAIAGCPIFVIALVWSVAEEITRWVRNWGHGIHPGAHVGVSLFLWLCCAVVGSLMSAFVGLSDFDCYYDSYDSSYYGSSSKCATSYGGSRGRFLAVVILLLVLWLVHFIIFVGACIDTAKRNAANSKPIMVAAQPPYWGPMLQQGWQQPMTQQVYPPQQSYYQQFQGMPVQPHTTSPRAVSGEGQGSRRGTQPEIAQLSTPADHGVREFYTPAGSSSAP